MASTLTKQIDGLVLNDGSKDIRLWPPFRYGKAGGRVQLIDIAGKRYNLDPADFAAFADEDAMITYIQESNASFLKSSEEGGVLT